MALLKLLMFFIYVIASICATVTPVNEIDRDIVDTIVGEQRIIGTWSLNGSSLAITVTKGNSDRRAAFVDGSSGKQSTVQFDRFLLKYNHNIMAASLVIPKVSRKDEGLYEKEEILYLTKPAPNDNFTERYMIQNGKWILELNVFETDEIQQGETGKSMAMEFEIVSRISILYNYVTVCAIMGEQDCSISTQSHLYGRLSFTKDAFHNIYRITINNVTQRDAGLYKVSTDRDESMRRFLNITEKPTCSVVGDNLTIGWFFNQQGIKRTLLVIHPNREVIMQLTPSNVPEIKSKFQHRLSYNGDVSRSFMMLSLLNVRMSDAGLYTIETQHGNTIPGCKQVNVEASCTTTSKPPTGLRLTPVNEIDRDIVDTIVGEQRIIGTWSLNGSSLAITVTKGNSDRLAAFIDGSSGKQSTVQFDRFLLKYNHNIMAASLVIPKVSRKDEGSYEIEETLYLTKPAPNDNFTERYMIQNGKWILELNVFETDEIQQGETGKSMAMEFEIVSRISTLYNYVTVCAIMGEQDCSISTQSHLHGRLSFTKDAFHNIYRITINNVTQRDAGLYKVSTDRDESMRRFLNITEKPTCSVVGDNLTIGWFFNQQGIKRTLLVIHPNREVIMQLTPSNVPEIKSKFQHRLSYNGDVSRSFMMLSLLNVRMSDAGLYTIETQHGNTIPGCKQVNVEASCTTTSKPPTGLRRVPIYVVIPVTIVTLAVVGYVIWNHQKRLSTLETGRLHSLEECDHELYITPIGGDIHLPIPLMNDGHASDPRTAQSDSRLLILDTNQIMCMDGYEMVDVSSIDAGERLCTSDETEYEPTETISKPVHDNFGYLTVLGVLETSV